MSTKVGARDFITSKSCNKIKTKDDSGHSNGWLLEILSERDSFSGDLKGQIYLSVVLPGAIKGYHLHADADYFVTCIKGKVREIIYRNKNNRQIIEMGDGNYKTVHLPKRYPHAIKNVGSQPAYVLVYRHPAWEPAIGDQLDIPIHEITKDKSWSLIKQFLKKFKR